MLSRRQFISRSGAAGAALVVAPQTVLEAGAAQRRLLRGGRFRQGVLSGDPTPRGITLLTLLDDVTGSGSVRLEVARDRDFRRVVARKTIATSGGARLLGQGARRRPAARRALLLPLRDARPRAARSAASRPRCRPTPTGP